MIQQTSGAITFEAFFTAAKVGKTGLTVTIDVYNTAGTLIVTAGAATETGGGFYRYTLSGASTGTAGAYRAVFKTSDATVDLQHVPSLWEVGVAGVNNLDAAVTSRTAPGDAMTLSMTQAVPTSNTANTVGDALNAARAQGFGKWVLSGTTLTLYAPNGSTVVRTFTLDDANNPTSRT